MEKLKEQKNKEATFEIMKMPEIVVNEERDAEILSLILKAKNFEWGNTESQIAEETKEYFEQHPLPQKISEFLEKIRALQDGGVDEEALYILALTHRHPEREKGAFEVLAKHKSYIENSQEIQQELFGTLELFEQIFYLSWLDKKLRSIIEHDKTIRQENMAATQQRIQKLIDFFMPGASTTLIRKVSLMPSDPLYRKDSGRAFEFGDELVVMSDIENFDNLDHEFLHSVINPIVDALSDELTDVQKEQITQLASGTLKKDYGESYYGLLNEEFIRTFNDVFKKGEKPQTYEDFMQRISGVSEEQFQKSLLQNKSLYERCASLDITSLEKFKEKSKEFFDRFVKNALRDLIFKLYQEYENRPDKLNINFEQFVLENFSSYI